MSSEFHLFVPKLCNGQTPANASASGATRVTHLQITALGGYEYKHSSSQISSMPIVRSVIAESLNHPQVAFQHAFATSPRKSPPWATPFSLLKSVTKLVTKSPLHPQPHPHRAQISSFSSSPPYPHRPRSPHTNSISPVFSSQPTPTLLSRRKNFPPPLHPFRLSSELRLRWRCCRG